MELRLYRQSDCEALVDLFYRSVHAIDGKHYSAEELDAWADGSVDVAKWNQALLSHHTVVAEIDGVIVGFGDIDATGYLDHLFVLPDFQLQGVASAICNELEKSTRVQTISVHASRAARTFFENRGYTVKARRWARRHGVDLEYFEMELTMRNSA